MICSCRDRIETLKQETTKAPVSEQAEPTLPESVAPTNDAPIETRVVFFEEPDLYAGPGLRYRKLKDNPVLKGQKIHIVESVNCWICFKTDTNATTWTGWTHRFLTRPTDEYSPDLLEKDIQHLVQCHLLVRIDPAANEAYVNGKNWNDVTPQIQEGIGRALAFYCGFKKGTGLNWVEISDAETNQRLAKYSENMGFKRITTR